MTYLGKCEIQLNVIMKINNPFAIIEMVRSNVGIGFCPRSFIQYAKRSLSQHEQRRLHSYPIADYVQYNQIGLAYNKNIFQPQYRMDFIECARDLLAEVRA